MYGQDDLFAVWLIGLFIVVVWSYMLFQFTRWSYTRIRNAIRRKYGYRIMSRKWWKVRHAIRFWKIRSEIHFWRIRSAIRLWKIKRQYKI